MYVPIGPGSIIRQVKGIWPFRAKAVSSDIVRIVALVTRLCSEHMQG